MYTHANNLTHVQVEGLLGSGGRWAASAAFTRASTTSENLDRIVSRAGIGAELVELPGRETARVLATVVGGVELTGVARDRALELDGSIEISIALTKETANFSRTSTLIKRATDRPAWL